MTEGEEKGRSALPLFFAVKGVILCEKSKKEEFFLSTFTGETEATPILSEKDLEGYFHQFVKPSSAMRVGLETEFFGVFRQTGKALPYEGPVSIHKVLQLLARRFAYTPIYENAHIIALQRDRSVIGLEPGGQIELSTEPVETVFEIDQQIEVFANELHQLHSELPQVTWLAVGFHPFSSLDDTPWVPKGRYHVMSEYLASQGSLSHEMMKLTASNQVNFDYVSEEHAMDNLRVAFAITSLVSALFSYSSFSRGSPNGFLSRRLEVWNHTDPARTGLLLNFLQPGKTFKDYLDYLLDMPMMFIVRQGQWVPMRGHSLRSFIREGWEGRPATLADFELHLSTAFPEVRLKQYLEIRGADCQSRPLIPAVAALWKGILYDPDAREEAWKLVSYATPEERLRLHYEVPRRGLRAALAGKPILPLAQELVNLSCISLARQRNKATQNECLFLDRIREHILKKGKSPAETLVEKWEKEFQHDSICLIDYLSI